MPTHNKQGPSASVSADGNWKSRNGGHCCQVEKSLKEKPDEKKKRREQVNHGLAEDTGEECWMD